MDTQVIGQFIELNNERFYRIENVDAMPSFFISMVSHSNHWLFVSSNTGLTAGRTSAKSALFPYEAVDKIEDNAEHSGNKTIIRVKQNDEWINWEPFNPLIIDSKNIQRNLYKHELGHQVCFEEHNQTLNLTFKYFWQVSDEFGFVVKSELTNHNNQHVDVEILDGLQNILPAQTPLAVQTEASNLIDAYRSNELICNTSLASYSLYSGITDKPEPVEVLRANTVFQLGLENSKTLLSSRQIKAFRRGQAIQPEESIRGIRGAYLVNAAFEVAAKSEKSWLFVANVEQSQNDIAQLANQLESNEESLTQSINDSVHSGTNSLYKLLAQSDAFQKSASEMDNVHHYANTLFNVMRGGIFDNQYSINSADLISDIKHFNHPVYLTHEAFFADLPEQISLFELQEKVAEQEDKQLQRLCTDYLPITFGRRHGDPSRPWNKFSINIKDDNGDPLLSYEGNWRDIFQNWEALLLSYPEFTENVISKFVNASTVDGYNPYRITKKGIDWEVEDPDDPWSYIGYWGDHQIIYLLKLLELSSNYHPKKLAQLLRKPVFSYANVPYRIKPFAEVKTDPKNTITYDEEEEILINQRINQIGADGKLMLDNTGQVYQVNLLEKLLVPLLSKLSNFVPRGGIWLNTQRPEWNDANNALVGQGLSMVTLYYMRRYVAFMMNLLDAEEAESANELNQHKPLLCSIEVINWLDKSSHVLNEANKHLKQTGEFSDEYRYIVLNKLGQAGSEYREHVYQHGFSGQQAISIATIKVILNDVLNLLDDSIHFNQREDKLYHAYNLLDLKSDSAQVDTLYEMLEGQVSALSAGTLQASEVVEVLQSLFASPMYRDDQKTFMLYPDEPATPFLEKNLITANELEADSALALLLQHPQNILLQDEKSAHYRFHHDLSSLDDLNNRIYDLTAEWQDVIANDDTRLEKLKVSLQTLYKRVFHHHSFTGRSHGMFGFEGLGCIYWHMVSKLLLATQECYFQALQNQESEQDIKQLAELYYRVREGIGFNKTPTEYGAFPYDPYSHTPMHSGAQQPGMTGQVKEEVLSRYGELGVRVKNGEVSFQPSLLKQQEFLEAETCFKYLDLSGQEQTLSLQKQSLAFTLCQTPIIYELTDNESQLQIVSHDGNTELKKHLALNSEESQSLFKREANIKKIIVKISKTFLTF